MAPGWGITRPLTALSPKMFWHLFEDGVCVSFDRCLGRCIAGSIDEVTQ